MSTATVNIALPRSLLAKIDATARAEDRSRSELLREATRIYIERKSHWREIFRFGERQARRVGASEADVAPAIAAVRRRK
jgi:metal-responsive CopG/Arc/MetJ family transcriptional regulator